MCTSVSCDNKGSSLVTLFRICTRSICSIGGGSSCRVKSGVLFKSSCCVTRLDEGRQ